MAKDTDIVIKSLRAVGQEDAEYLTSLIGSTPGFPKEGIVFRDFMPVLADARGLDILLRGFAELSLRAGSGKQVRQGICGHSQSGETTAACVCRIL